MNRIKEYQSSKKVFAMMKYMLFPVLAVFLFASFQQSGGENCDQKTLKDKCKETLKPYKYDSAKMTRIQFKTKNQKKEIEVPLFIGEKYRFVFTTMNLPYKVDINIYNKDSGSKKRELLFSTKTAQPVGSEYVYEPTDRRMKVYIDYEIPSIPQGETTGCLLFMLGYK